MNTIKAVATAPAIALVITLICIIFPHTARGKIYIDLDAPAVERLPIAIQEFIYLGRLPTDGVEAQ